MPARNTLTQGGGEDRIKVMWAFLEDVRFKREKYGKQDSRTSDAERRATDVLNLLLVLEAEENESQKTAQPRIQTRSAAPKSRQLPALKTARDQQSMEEYGRQSDPMPLGHRKLPTFYIDVPQLERTTQPRPPSPVVEPEPRDPPNTPVKPRRLKLHPPKLPQITQAPIDNSTTVALPGEESQGMDIV
ncbi:hypothetical protein FRC01_003427 [Tulasnella sp. 417]|nr:hypothetical protein FRC01_003427 [Tulasnella sp. 417]